MARWPQSCRSWPGTLRARRTCRRSCNSTAVVFVLYYLQRRYASSGHVRTPSAARPRPAWRRHVRRADPGRNRSADGPRGLARRHLHCARSAREARPRPLGARHADSGARREAQALLPADREGLRRDRARAFAHHRDGARPQAEAEDAVNLWSLLPPDCREAVAGDLEELWQRGAVKRSRWWRLALASVVACWIHRLRAGADRAPSDVSHTGDRVMHTVMQDLIYGLRQMRRAPGFAAAAVLTLGL